MGYYRWSLCGAVALSLVFAAGAQAADKRESQLTIAPNQPSLGSSVGGASEFAKPGYASSDIATYIVQLRDPAMASYTGGVQGFAATSPQKLGVKRLDVNSKASKNYKSFLKTSQKGLVDNSEKTLGRHIKVKYQYQHVLNGVAMELSTEEAAQMRKLANVKSVAKERIEMPTTDVGPQWIGAQKIWWDNYQTNTPGNRGEGAVIAILDTGINHDHPAFADVGGDGYDHTNPLGSGNYLPGSYCIDHPDFCNDKLIGAWDMVHSAADPFSPEDSDSHGSHTASTAAGNVTLHATLEAPTASMTRAISGVAPHANIIAYDVCTAGCPGSALIAALEQVIVDAAALPNGIQALNYSISGGDDPYNDAVELAFLNAGAAGVYVAVSAGNSGPGASTTGHNSPWVSATAALTHNRKVVNAATGLTSDGAPLGDITGLGFTAGYGPAAMINSADLEAAFPGSTLCGVGAAGTPPWPAGTFNGEIVVCTRGVYGRVQKGENVLAAGAGGYILMDNGAGLVGDAHVLPGVHISQADGAVLAAWMAANPNPMGSIAGFSLNLDKSNGDVMAGFSSRGPNLAIDVIKPDIGGPGVDIMAAVATDGVRSEPEYGFLSGTSMSSPHNAGSGALISSSTDWTPFEIKSAMMMTAKTRNTYKEDGVTASDPFDVGAGRINLRHVLSAGLLLDETPANFLAANPALGGDPKTLNIASMQDSNCVGTCSWTRTVTNRSNKRATWKLSAKSGNAAMKLAVSPSSVKLAPGESADVTVTANTTLANGWNFGELRLRPNNDIFANLHMPIAVDAQASTSANLTKVVDKAQASQGDVLTYQIDVSNGLITDIIDIIDVLPEGLSFVPGSASGSVSDGIEMSPLSMNGDELYWSFKLNVGGLNVNESSSPYGYFPLASLGIAPAGCPADCDDGSLQFTGLPSFDFNGQSYTSIIMSVNGAIEVGTASGQAASASNQDLPSPNAPNNLLAPFWTDLNLSAGGNWYIAVLNDGVSNFIVAEWEDVQLYGDPTAFSFQVWIEAGTSNIWYVYDSIPSVPGNLTVGVENDDGSVGDAYYFNGVGTAPEVATDLSVAATAGGHATATFQATIDRCKGKSTTFVNHVNMMSVTADNMPGASAPEHAIAVTQCVK